MKGVKRTSSRLLSLFVSFAMSVSIISGLIPGMSMTVYAASPYSSGRVRISDVSTGDIISKKCQIYKNNNMALEIYDSDGTTLLNSYGMSGFISNVQPGYDTIATQGGKTVKLKKLDPQTEVTSVSLDQPTLDLTAGGDTATLVATVVSNYDALKTVTWSSSDAAVATVSNGVVTPVSAGTATIKATSGWDGTKYAECAVTVYAAHTHNFTYTASGATITATCAEGCPDSYDTTPTTLTIAAEGGTYDGMTAYGATVTNNIPAVTGDTVGDVAYYKVDTEGATTGGTAQTGAPTDAGYYYASVTLTSGDNSYTVVKSFTVAKADPTAPTGLTATYGQKLSDVALPTGWTWADRTQSVGSVGSNSFKANFAGNDNYNAASNVDVAVTVSKAANPATITNTASVTNGGNTVDLANNVTKNGATGDVTYAISGEANGCSLNGSVLTSGDNTGSVTVNVTIAADDNYNALAATPITVTIDDKKEAEDTAAANEVTDKIDALPAADDVKTTDTSDIEAARAAYDALTDDQKAKVSEDTLKKLTDAETALADAEAAETVTNTINALPAATDVKTTDKDAIEAARTAYDALTDAQKAKVTAATYKKLTDAEEALTAAQNLAAFEDYKTTQVNAADALAKTGDSEACAKFITTAKTSIAALNYDSSKTLDENKARVDAIITQLGTDLTNQRAADPVIEKINALPAADDVKTTDKDAIEAARAAYDALTDSQKAKISATIYIKLTNAETALDKAIADQAAADGVADKINALPAATDVKTTDKDTIEAARAAYNALTDDQKARVSADTLKKLTDAEKVLADEEAAKAVSDKINALPAATDVKTTDKSDIEAARAAYDALTADQKAKVSADTLKKLTDAEDALVVLQVMSEVSSKTGSGMEYTGSQIQLINTPTTALPEGYTMKYTVTTENKAPDASAYSTTVPTTANAGTYYVWYMVDGEGNNLDTEAESVVVSIAKADIDADSINVSIESWVAGEETNAPVITGLPAGVSADNVIIMYAPEGSDQFTTEMPSTAGNYVVKVIVPESDNYKGATFTATLTVDPVVYSFVSGSGSIWVNGSNGTLSFTAKRNASDDKTFANFLGIRVDGKDVPANNYTAVKGSVVVTLSADYLNTLSVGEHTITFRFSDGADVTTSFTIKEAGKASPATGETMSIWTLMGFACLAAAGAVISFKKWRKEEE